MSLPHLEGTLLLDGVSRTGSLRLGPRPPAFKSAPVGEASACWRLTVQVLEMRRLHRADMLSEADPYVILQLPTAPGTKFRTKTVSNSSHPVWNETFSFLIQSRVKNVLELSVYDEDLMTKDDICFKVFYDISEVLPGKLLQKTFSLGPQGQEELDVEFLVEETLDPPEYLITNDVLVVSTFPVLGQDPEHRVGGGGAEADWDKLELELVLKGSFEDTQTSALDTASAFHFHYLAALDTELHGRLRDLGVRLQLKAESCPKELAVRLGFDLCVEEQAFLSRRKKVVAAALKQALQLDRDLQEEEVPVVGIMAEGGGARAMTSLYGHLLALKKLGLLDCVTYLSGISGATWTMAHLYRDPEWSQKDLQGPISHIREHMAKSKLRAFSPECLASYWRELQLRASQGHCTTAVDLWALLLEFSLHGQVTDQTLSGQREALEREWVEFSPYEVGFLKYGAFVPPELFGSEFFMGRLMRRLPESPICFLEGIWSNIFSLNLMDTWHNLAWSGEEWKQHVKEEIHNTEELGDCLRTSTWTEGSWLQPGTALARAFKGILTGRPLCHRGANFLHGLQLHQGYCSQKDFSTWADCKLDCTPSQLTPQQPQLCLVDTGYLINNSYPSMFRPGRGLDLILYFGYSLSSHFEALQQAELYCRTQRLPFPHVEASAEDQCQPKECYLFSDPTCLEAPVLLYFPLVNISFKDHSTPGVRRSPTELQAGQVDLNKTTTPYFLHNMTYSEEDFDRLLQLNDYNLRNSRDTVLQALRMALKRRAPEAGPSGAPRP
ncbi:Cytosolic phospholipase A2 delta [Fukomys damarensis]|uniref:Phospholipase A2 n=1 Tax=Fukomys damarensis TaxID=885580 RepID=A0A091DR63_FUKDA|nr:Cytosolic phospholipase A2 delta [Fukomys damarensis]